MVERASPLTDGDLTLVVVPGALGDTVLRLQALQVLEAEGVLGSVLWLVGTPEYLELAHRFLPAVRVSSFEEGVWAQLFCHSGHPSARLRENLQGVRRALVWLPESANAAEKLRQCGVQVTWVDPNRCRKPGEHQLAALARCAGLDPKIISGYFSVSDVQQANANQERMLLHPGAGSLKKRLPLEFYRRMAAKAIDAGFEVTWLLGPVENEEQERFLPNDNRIKVESDRSLGEVSDILQKMDVVAGNDSGVLHLAAALRKPAISVFVSSDPEVWHPVGPSVAAIDVRHRRRALRFFSGLREIPAQQVSAELTYWTTRAAEVVQGFVPGGQAVTTVSGQ